MPAWTLGSAELHLRTDRLVLRPPAEQDVAAVAELLGDPEVMRFLGGDIVPFEHHGAVVENWQSRWQKNGMGPFVIERRADGRFLGRTGILVWDSRTWKHTRFAEAGRFAQPELGWTRSGGVGKRLCNRGCPRRSHLGA